MLTFHDLSPNRTLYYCVKKLISADDANSSAILFDGRIYLLRLVKVEDFPNEAVLKLITGMSSLVDDGFIVFRF